MKRAQIIALLGIILAGISCGQEGTGGATSGSGSGAGSTSTSGIGVDPNAVGFQLPTSISQAGVRGGVRTGAARASELPDGQKQFIGEVFGAIRAYVGIADEFRKLIREMVAGIPTNLPDLFAGEIENGKFYLTVKPSERAGHTHRLLLDDSKGGTRIVDLDFDNVSRQKGIVVLNANKMDPTNPSGSAVRLTFDATDSSDLHMTVEAAGFLTAPDPIDDWKPDAIKIDARKQGTKILLSGNSHHPYAGTKDEFMAAVPRNYVFTAVIDDSANRATVRLAIPPDTATVDSEFFSRYGVNKVFLQAVYDHARALPASEMDFAAIAALPQIAQLLTTSPPTSNAAMTIEQFVDILKAVAQVDPTNKDVAGILFVTGLNNPAFFDSTGYVSNGDEAGISGWPLPSELDAITVIPPADVRDLKIAF